MSTTASPQPDGPTALVGRWAAALAAVLAVGAAVGVGQLVAGFVSPTSSPFVAAGDTVIRFSPQWLVEFAKTTFGGYDKPVLQVGMAVVLVALAAAAGAASPGTGRVGRIAMMVFGLIGCAAVLADPVYAFADILAPLAALVTAVLTFQVLHGLTVRAALDTAAPDGAGATAPGGPALDDEGGAPGGPAPGAEGGAPGDPAPAAADRDPLRRGVSRRGMLIGSSLAVGVGALGAGVAGELVAVDVGDSRTEVTRRLAAARITPAPPIPAGADFAAAGTPTFLTPSPDFYRVDAALVVPRLPASDWSLRVHGMVDQELRLTFDDLLARPLVEQTITMTCVSNEVGGPYVSTANFIGVSLRDVLLQAGPRPGADQVLSTGADGGWTAGTPTDVLLEPDRGALLAIGMNGEALLPEHGFPVRIVVPGLYGFVSATKWLTDIEVTTFAAKQSYWLQRGWGQRAPIKVQSRIDRPGPFERVGRGTVTVAGIAWAQPVGVGRVQVRADGGPWQEAELSTEVNDVTWRMWKIDLDLASGSRTVQVRATDSDGLVQPEARVEPIPDGATGWHSVVFTVA